MRTLVSCCVSDVCLAAIAGCRRRFLSNAGRLSRFLLRSTCALSLITIGVAVPACGQETTITVDSPVNGQTYSGTQVFGGWAVDSGSKIANVVAMIDGVTPGQIVSYGGSRQDVCDIYVDFPDCPNVGWNYSVDTTQLTNGWHYIRFWATTVDGRQTIQDGTFYASNPSASVVTIDAPSYGGTYSGTNMFSGWAVDPAATITAVRVFIDGAPFGNAAMSGNRQDVCNAIGNYPGCPYVGWTFAFDTSTIPDGGHEFTVTSVTADGRAATASILWFRAQNSQTTLVDIDSPQYLSRDWDTIVIGGWAMDSVSPLSSVKLSIDGIPYGDAGIGNRQDACDANGNWPSCPNVGWGAILDTTELSEGSHELAVTAVLVNGRQVTQTQPFVVQNTPGADSEALITPYETSDSGVPIKCNSGAYNLSSRAMSASPGADGVVHVTYSIDTADPSIAGPIVAAIDAWNLQKGKTGIEFDPPAPGKHVDLPFVNEVSADTKQACAYHDPNRNLIVYGNTWKVSNSQAAVIQHELGHYMGLDDAGTSPSVLTIMNQPSNGWPGGCTTPNTVTKSVTDFDTAETPVCRATTQSYKALINQRQRQINASKTPHQFTVTDPYPSPGGPGANTCTYIYESVDYYVDGEYEGTDEYLVDVICN